MTVKVRTARRSLSSAPSPITTRQVVQYIQHIQRSSYQPCISPSMYRCNACGNSPCKARRFPAGNRQGLETARSLRRYRRRWVRFQMIVSGASQFQTFASVVRPSTALISEGSIFASRSDSIAIVVFKLSRRMVIALAKIE
jgi:hypothetical protein